MKIKDRVVGLRRVRAADLRPNPKNWRTHPKAQREALQGILAEVGFADALLARELGDGTLELIDGHLRAETTPDMEVPVLVLDVDEAEAGKILATLDPLAALAGADAEKLEALLAEIGTTSDAVAAMLDRVARQAGFERIPGEVVEDDPPAPLAKPVSRPGDLWALGQHRLLCGDATKPGDMQRLFGAERAAMCFTDPPWNVAIGMDSNPRHRQRPGLANDNLGKEEFDSFLSASIAVLQPMVSGDIYCVLGASEWPTLDRSLRAHGFHWSATIVWVKDLFVLGRSKYHRRYEPIWYGWHESGSSSFRAGRDQDDVWCIDRPRKSEEHPTMKPVSLAARAIGNSSKAGEIVLDAFGGAGSTLMAAEQLGRRAFLLEIEPCYTDVIIRRWQEFTKQEAVSGETGKTWRQTARARKVNLAQE